jgi:hypothetical protein
MILLRLTILLTSIILLASMTLPVSMVLLMIKPKRKTATSSLTARTQEVSRELINARMKR